MYQMSFHRVIRHLRIMCFPAKIVRYKDTTVMPVCYKATVGSRLSLFSSTKNQRKQVAMCETMNMSEMTPSIILFQYPNSDCVNVSLHIALKNSTVQ